MKKILFVCFNNILRYPPIMSAIQTINDLGYKTVVLTAGDSEEHLRKNFGSLSNTSFEIIHDFLDPNTSVTKKLIRIPIIKRKAWKIIDNYYDKDSMLWVVDEITLRHLGKKLLGYRYILQLMEIREKLLYAERFAFLTMDSHAFGSKALSVVTCEYNRAHITRALWGLEALPFVLPNKPQFKTEISKHSDVTSSLEARRIMNELEGKKIILYQGIVSPERPLRNYISAASRLGSEYAFVLISGKDNPYPDIMSDNYYHIPFIEPPYHLEITSNAFIGVLSYTHTYLNTLYCAPNKIWEYAKFGIPMISTDLPSLHFQFYLNNMGVCIENDDEDKIIEGIKLLESNYSSFSYGALCFYNSVDYESKVKGILEYSEKKMEK